MRPVALTSIEAVLQATQVAGADSSAQAEIAGPDDRPYGLRPDVSLSSPQPPGATESVRPDLYVLRMAEPVPDVFAPTARPVPEVTQSEPMPGPLVYMYDGQVRGQRPPNMCAQADARFFPSPVVAVRPGTPNVLSPTGALETVRAQGDAGAPVPAAIDAAGRGECPAGVAWAGLAAVGVVALLVFGWL